MKLARVESLSQNLSGFSQRNHGHDLNRFGKNRAVQDHAGLQMEERQGLLVAHFFPIRVLVRVSCVSVSTGKDELKHKLERTHEEKYAHIERRRFPLLRAFWTGRGNGGEPVHTGAIPSHGSDLYKKSRQIPASLGAEKPITSMSP